MVDNKAITVSALAQEIFKRRSRLRELNTLMAQIPILMNEIQTLESAQKIIASKPGSTLAITSTSGAEPSIHALILRVLVMAHPSPCALEDIMKRVQTWRPGVTYNSIAAVISEAVKEGNIKRTQRGFYEVGLNLAKPPLPSPTKSPEEDDDGPDDEPDETEPEEPNEPDDEPDEAALEEDDDS